MMPKSACRQRKLLICVGSFSDKERKLAICATCASFDLRAQRSLNFHRNFRREKAKRSIDVRSELSSCFRDLTQRTQTPNLESAGVGEHGAIPADKFVQT